MSKIEYDWVSAPGTDRPSCTVAGAVLRKTENRYWNPAGGTASPARASQPPTQGLVNAYWSTPANPKRDSILESRVYSGADVNAKALTQFEYDDPSTTGNVTKELQWDSQLSASAPGVAQTGVTLSAANAAVISRSYVPGRKGLLDSLTDANNNITKYTYGQVRSDPPTTPCPATYVDLYPSSMTLAYGRSEAQIRQYYYDCATGVLKHDVFESNNNVRTTYGYDVYGRVTQQTEAAEQSDATRKRTTVTEYDDLNRRVRVVQDGILGRVSHFDQLGNLYLERENADTATSPVTAFGGEGIRSVTVERTEAGAAHYALTSNPHLPGVTDSEPTMGWTLRKFDKAGRVQEVSHYRGMDKPAPFGSNTKVTGREIQSYAGHTTTVTDLAGTSRSTAVDALGRMQSASEGGASSASYGYDMLDNLTSVLQSDSNTYGSAKTQTRTFVFSSLGRLVSATNPEADGAITYTYYPNGALKTLTDPRGVTTTYSLLDGLNRVLKRDYTATNPVTPNGRFCYDGKRYDLPSDSCVAAAGRGDYARGALTHAAARTAAGVISETDYTAVDPLGRVLASRQTTAGLEAKTFTYTYASGGALSGVQYPSGRWVSYSINGANRVSAVRNGQTGNLYYLQGAQYKPTGALASVIIGQDSASQWTEFWEFNSRLQARKVRVQKGTQKLLGLDWIYSSGATYNATQDMWEEPAGTATNRNNGNLWTEKLAYTAGTPFSVDRNYTYDAANRVASYLEPGKSQTFGYDAFGICGRRGHRHFRNSGPTVRPGFCSRMVQ